jgi:hypothetical protein
MKRQREADERERVRVREQRRAEKRAQRRGQDDTAPASTPDTPQPVLGVDGPRSLAELRAAQAETPGDATTGDADE